VRAYFIHRYLNLLKGRDFDGLFICLRSQSRPADFGDQFGFNQPVRRDFLKRYNQDICGEEFDLQAWRDLLGEYITIFLSELKKELRPLGIRLAIGAARGDILGPPLGNTTLGWREWLGKGVIDDLIINQNSSQCPSMWHQLWPMHRGLGYLQNYLDGFGMLPLSDQLDKSYYPHFIGNRSRLYVARQWDERSPSMEKKLLDAPSVCGLVFSSFRNDNPELLDKGDWRL
jgi:hypothetical protein